MRCGRSSLRVLLSRGISTTPRREASVAGHAYASRGGGGGGPGPAGRGGGGQRHPAETCGIVGVVGADDARNILLEGLTVLQNRGYDSAGMATFSDGSGLVVTKYARYGT
jgi:hypothetical protein